MSGRDVAIAALLGAEEFGFATGPLVAMGCMMMRVCSKDTCPAGIATQNECLRGRFQGKPEHVMNYMYFIARQLREIMAANGFRTVEEMVGRTDCLKRKDKLPVSRSMLADLSRILDKRYAHAKGSHFDEKSIYDFHLEQTKDMQVLLPALTQLTGKKQAAMRTPGTQVSGRQTPGAREAGVCVNIEVSSTDRSFGTILGSEVTRAFGNSLAEDSFTVNCTGGGGQSFGAFLPSGVTLRLKGDANDGFGKGLSGGKLILTPPDGAGFIAHENVIVGNVALYGATSGKAYICGIAGERFCVRNSGATAVAEGCGDHGLEYMTGGRAVILGMTGKNFAAGMSGGIAYVLDREHTLYLRMNKEMATAEEVTAKHDIEELKEILADYAAETASSFAADILEHFDQYLPDFKKIIPEDYRKMIHAIGKYEERGNSHEKAVLEAFREVSERG